MRTSVTILLSALCIASLVAGTSAFVDGPWESFEWDSDNFTFTDFFTGQQITGQTPPEDGRVRLLTASSYYLNLRGDKLQLGVRHNDPKFYSIDVNLNNYVEFDDEGNVLRQLQGDTRESGRTYSFDQVACVPSCDPMDASDDDVERTVYFSSYLENDNGDKLDDVFMAAIKLVYAAAGDIQTEIGDEQTWNTTKHFLKMTYYVFAQDPQDNPLATFEFGDVDQTLLEVKADWTNPTVSRHDISGTIRDLWRANVAVPHKSDLTKDALLKVENDEDTGSVTSITFNAIFKLEVKFPNFFNVDEDVLPVDVDEDVPDSIDESEAYLRLKFADVNGGADYAGRITFDPDFKLSEGRLSKGFPFRALLAIICIILFFIFLCIVCCVYRCCCRHRSSEEKRVAVPSSEQINLTEVYTKPTPPPTLNDPYNSTATAYH